MDSMSNCVYEDFFAPKPKSESKKMWADFSDDEGDGPVSDDKASDVDSTDASSTDVDSTDAGSTDASSTDADSTDASSDYTRTTPTGSRARSGSSDGDIVCEKNSLTDEPAPVSTTASSGGGFAPNSWNSKKNSGKNRRNNSYWDPRMPQSSEWNGSCMSQGNGWSYNDRYGWFQMPCKNEAYSYGYGWNGENQEVPCKMLKNGEDQKVTTKKKVTTKRLNNSQVTTKMIRNLPNEFSHSQLMDFLNKHAGAYDFVYYPHDFVSGHGLGYAFVNFLTPEDAQRCEELEGFQAWDVVDTEKVLAVADAVDQGLESNIEKYRNHAVMLQTNQEFKPAIFDKDGKRLQFPAPTKKIKQFRYCKEGSKITKK